MIKIYHLGVSQSERIVWLCEELDLPYELKIFQRDPVTTLAPSAYKALHPTQTAPVIDDGDLRLGESGAIIEYILMRYGKGRLRPDENDPAFTDYLFWFHFSNASLIPALSVMMDNGLFAHAYRARVDLILPMMNEHLSTRSWLAGDDFTAADIMMMFPLTTMRLFVPLDIRPFSHLSAYLKRVSKRPAYTRAIAKCEPGLDIPID